MLHERLKQHDVTDKKKKIKNGLKLNLITKNINPGIHTFKNQLIKISMKDLIYPLMFWGESNSSPMY